jgi:hypothetical protein
MAFNRERMLFSKAPKDVEIKVSLPCTICNRLNNTECGEGHDGGVEVVPIQVIGIPWAKLNYIKSQCVSFDDKQQTHFDSQQYVAECLKVMIVNAPWGATDDIFLIQVDGPLGAELEKLIPSAYGEQEDNQE